MSDPNERESGIPGDSGDTTPEPSSDAGINELRLDAERTRDELERTLDEIERRISPQRIVASVTSAWKRNPGPFIASAAGVAGGILFWAIRKGTSRG